MEFLISNFTAIITLYYNYNRIQLRTGSSSFLFLWTPTRDWVFGGVAVGRFFVHFGDRLSMKRHRWWRGPFIGLHRCSGYAVVVDNGDHPLGARRRQGTVHAGRRHRWSRIVLRCVRVGTTYRVSSCPSGPGPGPGPADARDVVSISVASCRRVVASSL